MIYRCPNCKQSDRLWREVEVETTGWEDVNDRLEISGDRDVDDWDWITATPTGDYGCSHCDWKGRQGALERVGIDGEPLVPPIPGQLEILA